MGRFRSLALTVIVLVAALSASDLSGKGKGGGGKHGGGHKPAPHRAAPKVHHAAHHSGPKPNRVARKPAPHHGGRSGGKQAHHSAKPKGPVKVSKPGEKHKETPKKDTGKKDTGKKDAGKKKPPEKSQPKHPDDRSKQAAHKPDAKKKDAGKDRRPDERRRDHDRRFVGRRHAERHHFAHFDHHHHWCSFDRHWWYNFVDYPNSCDDGSEMPGDYYGDDGDPGSWVNYEALAPPADVAAEPPVIKEGQGMPISRVGAILAGRLDAMDVENHWLPGQNVSWRTGNAVDDEPGPANNGCAFVAAVCKRFRVALAEPAPDNLMPESQIDWLVNEGTGRGWVALDGNVEAQLLANQGWVVVAAWKAADGGSDRSLGGQTAIVRPTRKPVEAVGDRGPQITVAGTQNHRVIALKDDFPPEAWDQVIYLACRPRW